ncbi:peptidoglycan bridge formation glycyltransferase FemA/FemB family protein [Mycolicibacterium moriokaense]|nr:peptidoglycan bridge formation glycyltransferase FemA/FemB family protein [Mycolicibacterium moriokaense]
MRRSAGFEPLYVFIRRDRDLVAGALVMGQRLPVVGEVGYVPYGPVISDDADRGGVITEITAALSGLALRTIKMLFIQPPLGGDDISLELQRRGFRPSGAGIAPVASLRLDLARCEEDLRAGLRKRLRTWTRSWPKRGVHVRRGTQDDIALFARLHAATAVHQGFEPLTYDYLATLYEVLSPLGHVELFIGEINGRPVAGRLYSSCGGVLKLRFAGMDRDEEATRLSVPAAVEWETIRWAKANGYRWFDFGGIKDSAVAILESEGSSSPDLRSIDAFKATFGGTPFRYPTPVEIISPRLIRAGYDFARRWPAGQHLAERTYTRLRVGRR